MIVLAVSVLTTVSASLSENLDLNLNVFYYYCAYRLRVLRQMIGIKLLY